MAFLGFGKKKAETGQTSVRIEAEDLLDQNYTCKEVAAELGITQDEVYRIKQAKGRREGRMQKSENSSNDELQDLRLEIDKARLQAQFDEIEHKNFMMRREREDILAEDQEEIVQQVKDDPDSLLTNLLVGMFLNKGGVSTGVTPIPNILPPVAAPPQESVLSTSSMNSEKAAQVVMPVAQTPPQQIQGLIEGIKSGLIPERLAVDKGEEYGLTRIQAMKLYDYIKKKL
jgi:predicted transcriptional regulator